ncbi:MAG TPA: DnaJ domain-containing protein [Geminicoccaceae bacterium]|nr:DnaJ domain-containing protein [Geminicoccaceae bacterium]
MLLYLLIGILVLIGLALLARHFVSASPAQLAQGVRAFAAAFSALASTGLLLAGRFGLALITIGATVMAIRALRRAPAGGFGMYGGGGGAGRPHSSEVTTDTLQMQLDHATGDLDGDVLRGRFAGRSLASLGLGELLGLIADCQRDDPRSVPLIETYLDRRQPDWRDHAAHGRQEGDQSAASASGGMDEATAWSVLGLAPGASEAEIKAAHRRLMTKLHPDHGGSGYLAAQLNQAKDRLLRGRS